MRRFAPMLERLSTTPRRRDRALLLAAYLRDGTGADPAADPDPEGDRARGLALAALRGALPLTPLSPAFLKSLIEPRCDPQLFALSKDFVGDLSETVALLWPPDVTPDAPPEDAPSLAETVEILAHPGRADRGARIATLFDRLDGPGRLAAIRLASGKLGAGVSPATAREALALAFPDPNREESRIEELLTALAPPYPGLFPWLRGGGEPQVDLSLGFRPMPRPAPVAEADLAALSPALSPAAYLAEPLWDAPLVQALAGPEGRRIYSQEGEDLSDLLPDLIERMTWTGRIEARLMVLRDGAPLPAARIAQRLARRPTAARLAEAPAHLRATDLLHDGEQDLRARPLELRRARLAAWLAALPAPERLDLSPDIPFDTVEALASRREAPPEGARGLSLRRRDAPHAAPEGAGLDWPRPARRLTAALLYVERGAADGAELTLGALSGAVLVPIGKAVAALSPADRAVLDAWVEAKTTEKFGPVRAVAPGLTLSVAYEAAEPAPRRKAGLVLREARALSVLQADASPPINLSDLRAEAGISPT